MELVFARDSMDRLSKKSFFLTLSMACFKAACFSGVGVEAYAQGYDQPPPATTAISPIVATIVGDNQLPEFVWVASPVATQYRLFVKPAGREFEPFSEILDAQDVCANPVRGSCKFKIPFTLHDNQSVGWWIGTSNTHTPKDFWVWSEKNEFRYLLHTAPPEKLSASDLFKPLGNHANTPTEFEWRNDGFTSWYLLKLYIQDSGFLSKVKWFTRESAQCQQEAGAIPTCKAEYAGFVGSSPFEDYCWTITPWNGAGHGPESDEQCFATQ